jgi:hypothetical protein
MVHQRGLGLAVLGCVGALAISCGEDDDPEARNSSGGAAGRGGGRTTGGVSTSAGGGNVTGGHSAVGGSRPTGGTSDGGSSDGGSSDGGSSVDPGASGGNSTGGAGTGGVGSPSGGAAPSGVHIPDVPPIQTGDVFGGEAVEGFEVTQSHYYAQGIAITDHFWLGAVVNSGNEMKCTLSVSVSIEAPGSAPVKFIGPVVAPMYRFEGLATRVYCLAPGERGVAVAQPFEVAPQFGSEDITVVRYGIAGRTAGDVIPADWVELRNVQVENEGAKSRVSGDIENASAVAGIAAVVFPKNAAGVPLVYYRVSNERTSAPDGSVWHFETPLYEGSFEDADAFYEHGTPDAP